jgi:CubicO group peptidase (beta-lactamase class C family)
MQDSAVTDSFRRRFGFRRSEVNLGNWRERPFSAWAFQNVAEIVPSALVPAERETRATAGGDGAYPARLAGIGIVAEGRSLTLEQLLEETQTDVLAVSRSGRLLHWWHAPHFEPGRPHIVFSVSKSVTGILAGILEEGGALETSRNVAHYLPQMRSRPCGEVPVRHLLDMRAGFQFKEDYLDQHSEFSRYRRAMGWNPQRAGAPREGLEDFLASLKAAPEGHGGAFRYLSPSADLAGLVLETAAGMPFAEVLSRLLWQPMAARDNAFVTVDHLGAPRSSGGVSATARDLLAVGEMLLRGGSANGRRVIGEAWISDMRHGGDEAAWAAGSGSALLPGGRYRSYWYNAAGRDAAFMAIGIHGQWLYCDPRSGTAIVRLGSQTLPEDDATDRALLQAFRQICAA